MSENGLKFGQATKFCLRVKIINVMKKISFVKNFRFYGKIYVMLED